MLDKSLFRTLFRTKLNLLFMTYGISIVFIALSTLPFLVYYKEAMRIVDVKAAIFSIVLQAFVVGHFIYLIIQAYTDYYTHFPLAIYMGKTRKQFLFSSLTTSILVSLLGVGLVVLLSTFLPNSVSTGKIEVIFKAAQLFFSGVGSFTTLSLISIYLTLAFHLLAALNYRTGARVWFFLLGVSVFLSIVESIKGVEKFFTLTRFLQLDYWSNLIAGQGGNFLASSLEAVFALVILTVITLRLSPIHKS